ncbi:MAG TPA: toxin-activating lysine-acyltransferase [Novosphingobium sp.]|nr:toxin-activating lysine-acyltransferase [Novosphingobium sp.]
MARKDANGSAGPGTFPATDTQTGPEQTGSGQASAEPNGPAQMDPEIAAKVAQLRSSVRENFGKAVMALMMVPRYRSQTLADLQHIVLEPLLRDRLAMAYPPKGDSALAPDVSGFAIWASVSEEVDQRIREQVREGVFPVRLRPEDWNSGQINWLFDVIAPDARTVASVIANFRQLAKEGELRLHPIITRLVDRETREKMGPRQKPVNQPAA